MQVNDILKILAKKTKLKIKGKPDAKFLRFIKNKKHYTFVVSEDMKIIAHKYTLAPDGDTRYYGYSRFNLYNPNSVSRILAFMND